MRGKILAFLLITLSNINLAADEEVCNIDGCEESINNNNTCVDFNPNNFSSKHNASIFVIESKGRLGNHLIAYTLVQALAKVMQVQPLIVKETHDYMSKYFTDVSVPVLQDTFCNWEDVPFVRYYGDIDDLVADEDLRRGKIMDLWPNGYKVESRVCCPSEELQRFVQEHYLAGSKGASKLKFQSKFLDYANDVKRKAAERVGVAAEDITFVGVHNRRTDYLEYMRHMYGTTKSPYNKRYFRDAMDYFREEHENVVFFYVSDDMEWGKRNLRSKEHNDLFFVGKADSGDSDDAVGYDLALLASCNHTIITWGSFSTWAAVLSGGEYYTQYGVIVPKDIQQVKKKKKKISV